MRPDHPEARMSAARAEDRHHRPSPQSPICSYKWTYRGAGWLGWHVCGRPRAHRGPHRCGVNDVCTGRKPR